ncbi:TetR/AcrR family transcriptional regulator [Longispora sp. K20-0274]|uniref:TetR/AcrR family transcriptional regulator n=1 Tax=Longispora sp. K20-0274 TaxID=3088255 RepID=UPI003999EE95
MTTEHSDLLWGDRQRPARGPKPGLSRDQIVAAAVELADAEGLAALSMARLAGRLGAGTMSLYRYVKTKDQLVAVMFDAALGEPPALDPTDWRAAVRAWAHGTRDAFRRHPWLLPLATAPRVLGPNEVAWTEAALVALSATGLPPVAAFETVFLINGYVRGSAQFPADRGGPVLDPALVPRWAEEGRFPTLVGMLTGGGLDGFDHRSESTFDFGLDRILDGLAGTVARHPTPPADPARRKPA